MGNITKNIIFNDLVLLLLQDLNDREKEVVTKRYALNGADKTTLERIGKSYDITRERVRQIENDAIKKIIKSSLEKSIISLSDLNKITKDFIEKFGGFISYGHLKNLLLHTDNSKELNALDFLLNNIVSKNFSSIKHPELDNIIKNENINDTIIIELAQGLHSYIESKNTPVSFEDLLNEIPSLKFGKHLDSLTAENHDIIEAVLRSHNNLDINILNQWGHKNWTTIKPKRMTDKAYLIMLKEERPLHFKECAELINQANFDKKKACAATVHNELILDDKYVLVGRGLYALKDWGFEAGTVSDIITKILKDKNSLKRKELSKEVLKQRMVQKTTITLALMNKDKFIRNENGTYSIA